MCAVLCAVVGIAAASPLCSECVRIRKTRTRVTRTEGRVEEANVHIKCRLVDEKWQIRDFNTFSSIFLVVSVQRTADTIQITADDGGIKKNSKKTKKRNE